MFNNQRAVKLKVINTCKATQRFFQSKQTSSSCREFVASKVELSLCRKHSFLPRQTFLVLLLSECWRNLVLFVSSHEQLRMEIKLMRAEMKVLKLILKFLL